MSTDTLVAKFQRDVFSYAEHVNIRPYFIGKLFPHLRFFSNRVRGTIKRHICGRGQLSIPPSVPQSARWQMPASVMFFVERILLATRRRIALFPKATIKGIIVDTRRCRSKSLPGHFDWNRDFSTIACGVRLN
jgi:hypothetical protein